MSDFVKLSCPQLPSSGKCSYAETEPGKPRCIYCDRGPWDHADFAEYVEELDECFEQRRRALEQVRKTQDRIRDLLALGHKAGVSHQRLGNIVGLSDVMVAMIIKGKRWT